MKRRVLYTVMALALVLSIAVPIRGPVMAQITSSLTMTLAVSPGTTYSDGNLFYEVTLTNWNVPGANPAEVDIYFYPPGPTGEQDAFGPVVVLDTSRVITVGEVVVYNWDGSGDAEARPGLKVELGSVPLDEGAAIVWARSTYEGEYIHTPRYDAKETDNIHANVIWPNTRVSIDIDTDTYPDRTVVAGQPFNLIITEENTGDVELTDVFVRLRKRVPPSTGDVETVVPRLDHTHDSWTCDGNGDDVLDAGETWKWTYTVTIEEDTRFIALGFGEDPLGNEISFRTGYEDERDTVTITSVNPEIQIKKYTNGNDAYDPGDADVPRIAVGDPVTWTYTVTNTGDVTLTNILVTDDKLGTIGTISSLASNASTTLSASGVAAAGHYSNIGTASTTYNGSPVSDTDPSHYFGFTLALDLEKHTNGEDADDPTGPHIKVGDPVTWEYIVTNNSDEILTDILVTDDKLGTIGTISSLASGASTTLSANGTATAGQYANLGTASATYNGDPISDTDPSHYFGYTLALDLEKRTNGDSADMAPGPYIKVGDPVTWEYIVTNNSNVTLSDIQVTDDVLGAIGTIASLAPGASTALTASGVATAGQYSNVGTASATYNGNPVSDTNPSHYFGYEPDITGIKLEKSVWNGSSWQDANHAPGPYLPPTMNTVVFRFVITNTSTVTLNVTLTDDDFTEFYTDLDPVMLASFPISMLAGTSETLFGSLPWEEGQHSNIATATGVPEVGDPVSHSDPAHYFGGTPPKITVGWYGQSVNKVAVLAPWIAVMLGAVAGAVLFVRRRQATG